MITTIGLVSGIITIVTLFVRPEAIGDFLYQQIGLSIILNLVTRYSKFVIIIPLFTGIIFSSRYGGFSFPRLLYSPLHLISSFIMFEFWLGFGTGVKYIGYLVIPITCLFLLKVML